MTSLEITQHYELQAEVADVYAAWVSSDTVIPPATSMDVNPVVGGHYRLIMDTPEFSGRNDGVFSLVEPGERVVYTWEWNGDGEISTIDVRFEAVGAGTRVTIFHSGFSKAESVANHRSGWDSYIQGLQNFLGQSV
ncbi:MAG: SRPBCC domain-containing protein [Pseudomonadaceae bacterium]|nr:SRPBCC domain-containing protein [Pseudomonadaceae bacterium]